MPASRTISALYLDYRPVAGHMPACSRAGTDLWEATSFGCANRTGETAEYTLRFACFECGAVSFFQFDSGPHTGEATHAGNVGYGSAPQRVQGLWLHPGPRIWRNDERGPASYFVTRAKGRPQADTDILGMVGWHLGRRGGVRWRAGLGYAGCYGSYGSVQVAAGQEFGSRRAAVAWIAGQPDGTTAGEGRENGRPRELL